MRTRGVEEATSALPFVSEARMRSKCVIADDRRTPVLGRRRGGSLRHPRDGRIQRPRLWPSVIASLQKLVAGWDPSVRRWKIAVMRKMTFHVIKPHYWVCRIVSQP